MGADLYALCEKGKRYLELLDKFSELGISSDEFIRIFKELVMLEEDMHRNYEYFRDPYNKFNLLWLLGLDWEWFGQFINEDCYVSPENCKKILEEVKRRGPITKEKIITYFVKKRKEEIVSIDELYEYFKEKYYQFIKFLEKCIKCRGMYAFI